MEFTISPYGGTKTVEQVMLIDGSIVGWLLSAPGLAGPAARIAAHIEGQLLPKVDAKPFVEPCAGCGGQATYLTSHHGDPSGFIPWCEDCDPYSFGAVDGRLYRVESYCGVLTHVGQNCRGGREAMTRAAKAYCRAKGAPILVTEIAARVFFQ